MKIAIFLIILSLVSCNLFGQTVDSIRERLGAKQEVNKSVGEKGFKQLNGKYYIVQVKDISEKEAGAILRHMDRLMEEFLKLYEYPFGTQKCFVVVYGLKKDFDRVAKSEHSGSSKAFAYRKGINYYAVTYYDEDLYPTLSHEAFHQFIENIFKREVPVWFNEGMACYYAGSSFSGDRFVTNKINRQSLQSAKEFSHSKRWPKIKDLVRLSYDEFYGTNSDANYAAGWCLVYYLKNKDEKAFKDFVNDLVLGKSFSTSLRQNYSIDQKQLEEDLTKYITSL